jgi:hypothetical protein
LTVVQRSARFDGAQAIAPSAPVRARFRAVSIEALRNFVLWLFVACGATAIIEPSPYEFMFPIVVAAFAGANGLLFDRSLAPMIVALALFNASGFLVLTPFVDDAKSVMFICISAYMALTAIVLAAIVARDPLRRMPVIRSGYAAAGAAAAVLGILVISTSPALGRYSPFTTTRAPPDPSRIPTCSLRSSCRRSSGRRRICCLGAPAVRSSPSWRLRP